MLLRNVALLNDASRHQFSLVYIKHCGHLKTENEPTSDDITEKDNEVVKIYNLESTPTLQQVKWPTMDFLSHDLGYNYTAKYVTIFLCFCWQYF